MRCNIPGPGCDMTQFSAAFAGCRCIGTGNCDSYCRCITRHGLPYSPDGCLLLPEDHAQDFAKPIVECNSDCSCSHNCINRLVQNGITASLEVFCSATKGFGIKSLELISQNKFVCEYAGEIISYDEAMKRTEALTRDDMNYILVVKEHFGGRLERIHVDPSHFGNIGRFINHSCEPNLFMIPVRVDTNIPKICLFAKRDILPNEELTYHYSNLSYEDFEQHNVPHESDRKICHCESKHCSGFLPMDESLFRGGFKTS